jgi:Ni/Fe-hydrogenase subunit HybB-like protein
MIMQEQESAAPLKRPFFTPGVIILCILAVNGLIFLAGRFVFGFAAITHLNNQYPWGLWIAVDVAACTGRNSMSSFVPRC